jgi:hypothetical protein
VAPCTAAGLSAGRAEYDTWLAAACAEWLDEAVREAAAADAMRFRGRARRSTVVRGIMIP